MNCSKIIFLLVLFSDLNVLRRGPLSGMTCVLSYEMGEASLDVVLGGDGVHRGIEVTLNIYPELSGVLKKC